MSGHHDPTRPGMDDEIGELASQYLERPDSEGLREIERLCNEAVSGGHWDDLGKWHRVRLRYLRYRQQQHRPGGGGPVRAVG